MFTVTNLLDSGAGSLFRAVRDADATPGADQVEFSLSSGPQTIILTSGELQITGSLEIDGPGFTPLSVSGDALSRAFDVGTGESSSNEPVNLS